MKAKTIEGFIKQVSLNGTVEKIFLEPCPEGTKASIKNEANTVFLVGILNGLQIKEPLPIKNSKDFIDALSWVGGDVTLEKVETRLFISSDKDGKVRSQEIGLISEEYAKSNHLEKLPELVYEGGANVETSDLKDMAKAWAKLGKNHINIKVEDNKLTFKANGDTDNTKIESPIDYYNCEGYFGSPLVDVIDILETTEVKLHLSKDEKLYPIKLISSTEDSLIVFIVAPKEVEE